MDGTDTGPAEGWGRDCRGDGALRLGDDAELPRALRGRDGHVLHEPVDVEPLRVGLVADLEHRAAVLDPVTVDVAAEELAAVQAASDRVWNGGRKEPLFPENRVLPAQLLRRHLCAVRKLERGRVPLVRHDQLELEKVGALPR